MIRRRGFTLFELVVTLAIVAAVGLLVLPRLASTRRGRVEDQARAAVALARKARALAAAEGRTYLLVVDGAARELRLARRRDPLAAPAQDGDPEREVVSKEAGPGWSRPVPFGQEVELSEAWLNGAAFDAAQAPLEIPFRPAGDAAAAELVFAATAAGEDPLRVRIDASLGLARIVPAEEAPQ